MSKDFHSSATPRTLVERLRDLAGASSHRWTDVMRIMLEAADALEHAALDPQLERLAYRAAEGRLNPGEATDAAARLGSALVKGRTASESAVKIEGTWDAPDPGGERIRAIEDHPYMQRALRALSDGSWTPFAVIKAVLQLDSKLSAPSAAAEMGSKSAINADKVSFNTRGTVDELRRFAAALIPPDDRELVQHAADLIEVLSKSSARSSGAVAPDLKRLLSYTMSTLRTLQLHTEADDNLRAMTLSKLADAMEELSSAAPAAAVALPDAKELSRWYEEALREFFKTPDGELSQLYERENRPAHLYAIRKVAERASALSAIGLTADRDRLFNAAFEALQHLKKNRAFWNGPQHQAAAVLSEVTEPKD